MSARQKRYFNQNLSSYCMAATTLAALFSVEGNAAVISYDNGGAGWNSFDATEGTGQRLLSLNLAGDVLTDGTDTTEMQFAFDYAFSTSPITSDKMVVVGGPGIGTSTSAPSVNAARLSGGTTIGASTNTPVSGPFNALTGTKNGSPTGAWQPEDRGFIGLAFKNGSETNYGWADITVHDVTSLTLHSFAYESNPSADIITPVPEPTVFSTLLMAGGAAGLVALRQRRKKTSTNASRG